MWLSHMTKLPPPLMYLHLHNQLRYRHNENTTKKQQACSLVYIYYKNMLSWLSYCVYIPKLGTIIVVLLDTEKY